MTREIINIKGFIDPEHKKRWDELYKASGKKSKVACFKWLMENARI